MAAKPMPYKIYTIHEFITKTWENFSSRIMFHKSYKIKKHCFFKLALIIWK